MKRWHNNLKFDQQLENKRLLRFTKTEQQYKQDKMKYEKIEFEIPLLKSNTKKDVKFYKLSSLVYMS